MQGLGLVGVGRTLKAARLSRDLYHRAIEVMAGAHALGRFVSLTTPRASRSSTGRSSSTSSRSRRRRGVAGHGRARHRRRRRDRAARRATRSPSSARAVVASTSTATGAEAAIADSATRDLAVAGRRHERGRRRRRLPRDGARASAASTSSSRTPASPRARRSRRRPSADWDRNHAILGTRLLPRRARGLPLLRAQGTRRHDRLRRLEERARRRAATPPRTRPRRPRSCTSRAASRRRAAPHGIRVNTVNPDAVLAGLGIWDSSWREERARAYGIHAGRARGALPQRARR